MEVHLPHKPIDSWREFFVHLFTITVGLLIALGLEGSVEWLHHRHLVHEARANIRQELTENQSLVQKNMKYIREDEERMKHNLELMSQIRDTHKAPASTTLSYSMSWSGFSDSAWHSARDTGALGFMEYKEVQRLSDAYSEQDVVDSVAVSLFHDQSKAISPIFIYGEKAAPDKLKPEELNIVLQRSADLLMGLKELEQVLSQLNDDYTKTLKEEM